MPATQISIDIIVEIPNISLVTSICTIFGGRQTPLPQIGITQQSAELGAASSRRPERSCKTPWTQMPRFSRSYRTTFTGMCLNSFLISRRTQRSSGRKCESSHPCSYQGATAQPTWCEGEDMLTYSLKRAREISPPWTTTASILRRDHVQGLVRLYKRPTPKVWWDCMNYIWGNLAALDCGGGNRSRRYRRLWPRRGKLHLIRLFARFPGYSFKRAASCKKVICMGLNPNCSFRTSPRSNTSRKILANTIF